MGIRAAGRHRRDHGAIDGGRVKVFCVNTNNGDSFGNERAHPRHRSFMQAQYDDYIVQEVMPFVRSHCQSQDVGIWTMGASLGGYHAANTLLKHPDVVKRCFALSGVYDMRRFMGGDYDDNFYFNNPVDYMANMSDGWALHHLASCDLHLATGHGSVGTPRGGLPPVGHPGEPRRPPQPRRLGPARRARLALLAPHDVGIHRIMFRAPAAPGRSGCRR